MEVTVNKIDPHNAEESLSRFGSFSARSVTVDGNEIVVLIYSNGPWPHHNIIERAIDAIPTLRKIV